MSSRRLLVCDLDNTLYDWVGYFVSSFYAMVEVTVKITGCNRDKLLDDLRFVHQKYDDSEQPFSLLETSIIREMYGKISGGELLKILDPAFHAFNSARKKNLKLHPLVKETLKFLKENEIILVAHTESKLYGVVDRMRRLDIFQYFEKIYCRERSISIRPYEDDGRWLDDFPMDKVVELAHHQTKPNPDVLLEICARHGVSAEESAYVGDSIARDILMAKRAGVFAIWAAYGSEHPPAEYGALVRISHWTPEEIAREQRLKEEAQKIRPDYVARLSFAEVPNALGSPF